MARDDVLVDDNNGVLTKYINGPGVDNKLKMTTNGTVRYFVSDHLGSTNALTDATGAVVEQTQYDSYGNATSNLSTRYQFTGREFDKLTGLHYYRARWYDASVGRFISEDPIGFAGGDVNLYGYVGNTPTGFVDPSGLQAGPTNYLRDPVEHDSAYNLGGLTNGVSNTVSDLLMLDSVAEWAWTMGDYRCSTSDRLNAGAKLAAWTAYNAFGGFLIGKALGVVGRAIAPYASKFRGLFRTRMPRNVGWEVGQPITNLTRKGTVPKWRAVRERHWKNRAFNDPSDFSPDNLALMGRGRPPQRVNPMSGVVESMELHHTPIPQRNGGLFEFIEVWPDEHRILDPFRR